MMMLINYSITRLLFDISKHYNPWCVHPILNADDQERKSCRNWANMQRCTWWVPNALQNSPLITIHVLLLLSLSSLLLLLLHLHKHAALHLVSTQCPLQCYFWKHIGKHTYISCICASRYIWPHVHVSRWIMASLSFLFHNHLYTC